MIKIHQYNDSFIDDIRFWVEVCDGVEFRTSWIRRGSNKVTNCISEETGLQTDSDTETKFYYNGELNET